MLNAHVMAPGTDIFSTIPNGMYKKMTGTSMACPQVAGLAALVMTMKRGLTPVQVKSLIETNVQKRSNYKKIYTSGGLIDVEKTLKAVRDFPGMLIFKYLKTSVTLGSYLSNKFNIQDQLQETNVSILSLEQTNGPTKSLRNLDLVKALLDTNTLANKSIQLSAANLLELISWTARTSAETVGMVDLLRLVELNIARILQQAKPKSNRFNTSKYRATKRHIGYYLINFMIDDVT